MLHVFPRFSGPKMFSISPMWIINTVRPKNKICHVATIYSNLFSHMKVGMFWFKFYMNLMPSIELTTKALWEHRPQPCLIWGIWNSLAKLETVYAKMFHNIPGLILELFWKFNGNLFMCFPVMFSPKLTYTLQNLHTSYVPFCPKCFFVDIWMKIKMPLLLHVLSTTC